ncbi:FAD-dependent oxidoreductase [Nocardia sp. 2]|uniref:ferredoxin--NADP(+) reductase n=1 Tax=Nocardia acididurans TaxID=2802282 RepID=A0ABS1M8D1_9NOCA|nr:FAD-dependent oxidoreductase [Nocardia acididurans]MBL1076814.1 FAD-dependent oxidoreductase [Nocardia acididurans]
MTFVITQSCCGDAGCVAVCPVNCIHPTPGEAGFATAEMLYIDPASCIDCGLCVLECPVGAIASEDRLDAHGARFLRINADYYTDHDVAQGLSHHRPLPVPRFGQPLRVAIVGAGPAGLYTAAELLTYEVARVDVFDRLPTPHGLLRAGVAPDHPLTKSADSAFSALTTHPRFRYLLNIEVGTHLSHQELLRRYDAVVYAVGAPESRRLGIPGEESTLAATDFAAWYNGHPEYAGLEVDLSGRCAVVIGNGNVALDVARILLTDPDRLAATEIADHALHRLRDSRIEQVEVLGRREIAQAAFTIGEFLAMGELPGVEVVLDPAELALDEPTRAAEAAGILDSTVATRLRVAREFAARPVGGGRKRLVFRFLVTPLAVTRACGVTTLSLARNTVRVTDGQARIAVTDDIRTLDAGLVVRAVGSRGRAVPGVPFDSARGGIPNHHGRVLDRPGGDPLRGVYVTGWAERGARGGIGLNRHCAIETATALLTDFIRGALAIPRLSPSDLPELAARRGAEVIDSAGWQRIDTAEQNAGACAGRPRVKLVDPADLRAAARPSESETNP